jgi:hypothetical protein
VHHFSVNTKRPKKSMGSKSKLKSRKPHTSVKRLIQPMAKMLKGSFKQTHYSPMEQEPTEQLPAWQSVFESTDIPRDINSNYHELPADRSVCELAGTNVVWSWATSDQINELDAERPIGELQGSELEWPAQDTQTPILMPSNSVAQWNVSNTVSPISYPSDQMQCPTKAISSFMLDQQVSSPISPQSTTSPFESRYCPRAFTTPHQPMPQFEASHPVGLGIARTLELDAGFEACNNEQIRQASSVAKKNFSSWCRSPEERSRISVSNEEIPSDIEPTVNADPAQLGYQKGVYEDCRRARQASNQGDSSRSKLNKYRVLPVLWDSPVVQEPLIGMVESIYHQLRPQGAKVLHMLEDGAEKITKKCNTKLREQWNKRGNLSGRDLPSFLGGWMSTLETPEDMILDFLQTPLENMTAGQLALLNTASNASSMAESGLVVDHVATQINSQNHRLETMEPANRALDDKLPQERSDIFEVPMMKPSFVSQPRPEEICRSTWVEPESISPQMMHR